MALVARRRRALAVVLAPVLAVHVGALMLSASAAGQPAHGGPAAAGLPAVRLVAMVAAVPTRASTTAEQPQMREQASKNRSAGADPAHPPETEQVSGASTPAESDSATAQAAPPLSTGELGGTAAGAAAEPDYLPRERLSVAPRPLASIDIPFPPDVPGTVNLATELSLFIDETGTVRRVRVDGAALPPALEDAARSSFLAARFTPGELDGAPVRALIRVAVSFETEALPPASATR